MSAPVTPLSERQRQYLTLRMNAYAGQLGPRGCEYLERRGISSVAHRLRFGEVVSPLRGDEQFSGRLAIPTLSARGTPVGIAYRCMEEHDCGGLGHGKYLNTPNYPSRLYNVGALSTAGDTICIAEGQIDAATLEACGLDAVAMPGVNTWRPSSHRLFQGFGRILFFADQDDKGSSMTMAAKIRTSLSNLEVMHLPDGYDVNSFYVQHGPDAIRSVVADGYSGSTEDDSDLSEGEDPDEPDRIEPVVHYDDEGRIIPF